MLASIRNSFKMFSDFTPLLQARRISTINSHNNRVRFFPSPLGEADFNDSHLQGSGEVSVLQFFDHYIPVPNRIAMILQRNFTGRKSSPAGHGCKLAAGN
jgi:hypothetical protein